MKIFAWVLLPRWLLLSKLLGRLILIAPARALKIVCTRFENSTGFQTHLIKMRRPTKSIVYCTLLLGLRAYLCMLNERCTFYRVPRCHWQRWTLQNCSTLLSRTPQWRITFLNENSRLFLIYYIYKCNNQCNLFRIKSLANKSIY